jgi:hypothetical protein
MGAAVGVPELVRDDIGRPVTSPDSGSATGRRPATPWPTRRARPVGLVDRRAASSPLLVASADQLCDPGAGGVLLRRPESRLIFLTTYATKRIAAASTSQKIVRVLRNGRRQEPLLANAW